MSDSPAQRTNQREHILDTALDLMAQQGSAGMSMRQLAQACGVQVAAIYHYFPSKEALLSSVIDERRYTARLEDEPLAVDADAPVEIRLRAVFEVFWAGALEEERVLRLLLGEALRNEEAALPRGSSLLEVFRVGVVGAIEELIPEIQDPKSIAELLIAHVFSAFIQHVFEPDTSVEAIGARHADVLTTVVLGGSSG